MKSKTLSITLIALFAVIITLCAWITIPFAVPFTLQTFGVFCALLYLGGKRGTTSILIYILLGAVGIPVFSSFGAGLGKLLGPTGGYILGFLLTGVIYILFENKNKKIKIFALALGLIVCYIFGTLWFYYTMDGKYTLWAALMTCVVPFILPDAAKLALAVILTDKIKKAVPADKE